LGQGLRKSCNKKKKRLKTNKRSRRNDDFFRRIAKPITRRGKGVVAQCAALFAGRVKKTKNGLARGVTGLKFVTSGRKRGRWQTFNQETGLAK